MYCSTCCSTQFSAVQYRLNLYWICTAVRILVVHFQIYQATSCQIGFFESISRSLWLILIKIIKNGHLFIKFSQNLALLGVVFLNFDQIWCTGKLQCSTVLLQCSAVQCSTRSILYCCRPCTRVRNRCYQRFSNHHVEKNNWRSNSCWFSCTFCRPKTLVRSKMKPAVNQRFAFQNQRFQRWTSGHLRVHL